MTKEEFIQQYVLKYLYSVDFKTSDECIKFAGETWQKIHDKVKEEAPIQQRPRLYGSRIKS